MHELSPSEYREYNRHIMRDFGSDTHIDLRCCPSYQTFQQAWIPQMALTTRNQNLLRVRFPPIKKPFHLRWETYQSLMKNRIEWMIFKWVENGEDKFQTYERLRETLYRLDPKATPPSLTNYPGWEWAEFWGDCLIGNDQTWTALFQQNSSGLVFPKDITPDQLSSALMEIHDSIHLSQFLFELVSTKESLS